MGIDLALNVLQAVRARDLDRGEWFTVISRKRQQPYRLLPDDPEFFGKGKTAHDWIYCRDEKGMRIDVHIREDGRLDRIYVTGRPHESARTQIPLPLSLAS